MVEEARLEAEASGLAPGNDGWFVVNARDATWLTNEAFGAACVFEGRQAEFADLGFRLRVLLPGEPNCMYHAESGQEDFLVLAGECLLLVEGEERHLQAWDFVHCPSHTKHVFVGAGEGPCVIVMVGARNDDGTIVYPVSELARSHGAGVKAETTVPREAYAPFPEWEVRRPAEFNDLPWAGPVDA